MTYDVIVIGGGSAGMSAAVALGRALRTVLLVDAAAPRNARAGGIHNYLTRDGIPPADFRAQGRAEVTRYGGQIIDATVATAAALEDGLEVTLTDGRRFHGRRVLAATGLTDELPDIPGLREQWGRGVLHCPYCHGYEVRGQAIGIIGTSPIALHHAQLWRQWTEDVVLFQHTAPEPDASQARELAARGIRLVAEKVSEVVADGDRVTGVRLIDGTLVARDAVVAASRLVANAGPLRSLGLEVVETDFGTTVAAEPNGRTAVPGVWVAGNVTDPMAQVVSSAAAGLQAAAMLNMDLIAEDVARAAAG
ncbi:NAD(P)/FAD-dependent oxidoreductase [Actinoplanes sp. NPDC049548]|uniref:NAD(P)/FAD-dependent oxidoreductase n=1 Tax=Actinoplanes sp. NPDC049548 TaxID=3155152 RepID=UPI003415A5C6